MQRFFFLLFVLKSVHFNLALFENMFEFLSTLMLSEAHIEINEQQGLRAADTACCAENTWFNLTIYACTVGNLMLT